MSVLNYDKLMKLLKSKDLDSEEVKQFDAEWEKYGSRFLDKQVLVPKVAFTSFPRSGNSLTRRLVE